MERRDFQNQRRDSHHTLNNCDVGTPAVAGAKVVCEVVEPLVKGDKVLVFHKKRRKGYRKLNGYRHQYTQISIKQVIA